MSAIEGEAGGSGSPDEDKRAIATLYGAAIALMCHQDRLAWSFVTTVALAQSLVLSAAFALRHSVAAHTVLIIFLLIFMFVSLGLYRKLCADRDVNKKIMEAMVNSVLTPELKKQEWMNANGAYISYSDESWRWKPLGIELRATQMLLVGFIAVIVLDMLFLVAPFLWPSFVSH